MSSAYNKQFNFRELRYLGVMFNASGSFSDAKEELYKRGLKALFKMYKCFEGHKPVKIYKISYEFFLLLGHYIILKNNDLPCLIISGDQMYPTLHYHMLK
jgi:hypothetical protein